jgi:hypothetical protein
MKEKATAIITPNRRGGWSLILPVALRDIGNYATPEKASKVALINGYEPEVIGNKRNSNLPKQHQSYERTSK